MAETDLSKIINLIMENPQLVEQIKDMVNKSEAAEEKTPEPISESSYKTPEAIPESPVISESLTYAHGRSSRRSDLLRALRPYVSEERGKAIESMITIADILVAVREK